MNVLGWILAVFGFVGVIFRLRMMLKGKKMGCRSLSAPLGVARAGSKGGGRQRARLHGRPGRRWTAAAHRPHERTALPRLPDQR